MSLHCSWLWILFTGRSLLPLCSPIHLLVSLPFHNPQILLYLLQIRLFPLFGMLRFPRDLSHLLVYCFPCVGDEMFFYYNWVQLRCVARLGFHKSCLILPHWSGQVLLPPCSLEKVVKLQMILRWKTYRSVMIIGLHLLCYNPTLLLCCHLSIFFIHCFLGSSIYTGHLKRCKFLF